MLDGRRETQVGRPRSRAEGALCCSASCCDGFAQTEIPPRHDNMRRSAGPLLSGRIGGLRNYTTGSAYNKTLLPRLHEQLKGIEDAGLYKRERIIISPQSSSIVVQNSSTAVLNFCANNYLGKSCFIRPIHLLFSFCQKRKRLLYSSRSSLTVILFRLG